MIKKQRIENAIEIINYAIKNQITVTKASLKSGYADTYVKNVKAIVYDEYNNGILGDELFNMFNEAYERYNNSNLHNIQQYQENNKEKPNDIPTSNNEKTKFNVNGNTAEFEWVGGLNYPKDHIRTLDQLLKMCDVDLNIWNVKDYTINKWDVTSWKNKNPETIQNFQVKARLEKRLAIIESIDAAEYFKKMIIDYKPPVYKQTLRQYPIGVENNLFEVSIFDLHLGKLAWSGETGENFDTKIARTRFLDSIETLIQRASGFPYSRILFPIGNDFFNSDNLENTTTKGTPQDEDLRWQKTYMVGTKLIVDAINLLKQTGVPIDVIVIPGNHDFTRSFYLGSFVEAWFNEDDMVNINNGASPRKYYNFGKLLLGFTHGSEEKESSLPLLMATDIESKPMWSETFYHEWHVAHIHRKRNVTYNIIDQKERSLNEDLGVTIRYLSSLTGTEEWHHKKGFVGCTKAADAFIWNDKTGLIAHLNSNLMIK